MPQKALCGEFYQSTHVSVLRVSSVQRPLIMRLWACRISSRTSAETLQGTLSPSAALYGKSAVEYLLNLLVAA